MISEFLKYCYFWIDILGFLTQTFELAPRMFSNGVPPGGHLFSQGGAHTSISLAGMLVREQISTTQKN